MHHEHYSRSCNLQPNGTSEKKYSLSATKQADTFPCNSK